MQGCFNGRTSRASLHTHKHETCLPVYSSAVNQIDNQQLNLAFQSHPFCTVTSPISHGEMTHVAVQYGPYFKPGHSLPVLQETQPAPPKTNPESLPIPTPTLPKGGSPSLRAWRMLHSVCPRREYSEGRRACKPLLCPYSRTRLWRQMEGF